MLRCYESQLLVLFSPVPFTPASNLAGPHVQEIIADVERMRRKIRDDFPEALGRQEPRPDKSEVVEIAEDAAAEGSSKLPDAIVEPVNVARAEDEIIILRKLYQLVRVCRVESEGLVDHD